jgi:hypothetical protein
VPGRIVLARRCVRVLSLVGDDDLVGGLGTALDMLAHWAAGAGALVVAAGVRVALDLLLAILAPPGGKEGGRGGRGGMMAEARQEDGEPWSIGSTVRFPLPPSAAPLT